MTPAQILTLWFITSFPLSIIIGRALRTIRVGQHQRDCDGDRERSGGGVNYHNGGNSRD